MAVRQRQYITVFLITCLASAPELDAQYININNFYYRDFLDMGQNRGIFGAGSNVTAQSGRNPNVSVNFQHPFLDQSARSNNGSLTSLGRNFVVTAHHVNKPFDTGTEQYLRTWGQTEYATSTQSNNVSGKYGRDVRFARLNKYIVEGQSELLDAGITGTTQTKTGNTSSESGNIEKLQNKLENIKDSDGKIHVYQAGQGFLTLINDKGTVLSGEGIAARSGLRGGSYSSIVVGEDKKLLVAYSTFDANTQDRGMNITITPVTNMFNKPTQGDSGSAFYVYDSKNNKWVLLAVHAQSVVKTVYSLTSYVGQGDFDDYKKKFEQTVDLKGQNWNLSNSSLQQNGGSNGKRNAQSLQGNKDIIFQGGGNVEVQQGIYRNTSGQFGGFVFKATESASESNPTVYKFTNKSGSTVYGFDGAGLDIEKNAKVEWGLGFVNNKKGESDALHKVGEGTLVIKTYDSTYDSDATTPTDGKYGYLRVGDGKVIFDTDKQAFNGVYLTSGRGTLELTKGKGQAFGATEDKNHLDDKLHNHFILGQDTKKKLGLYFGNNGGNFDLKGNSLTLNTISSNDSKANIINTDSDTSTMTIEGYGYNTSGSKTTTKADTIIHASFGQSAGSATDKKNNNNINLVYKGDPTDDANKNANKNASLVFDGNVNVNGLEVSNGNVTLQGHPTTHAYIKDNSLLQKVKTAEGNDLPSWMDLSRPSTLEQPDWDHRTFNIGKVDIKESNLNIGREATLNGDITADNSSTINFGGNIDHFIDKKDGENTTGNGFDYSQEVEKQKLTSDSQKLANQSIHFKGSITANGTTINSSIYDLNAKLAMTNAANLTADYLTLDRKTHASGAIASLDGNNTSATVNNLILKGLSDNATDLISLTNGAKFTLQKSIGFNSSTFDLSKLSSINGLTLPASYDVFAQNSSNITGDNTDIKGNVGVMGGSTLTLKTITLQNGTKDSSAGSVDSKNSIIVDGENSKLDVKDNISSTNQDVTNILITGGGSGKTATLSTAKGIELTGTTAQSSALVASDNSASNVVLKSGGKLDSNLTATNLKLAIGVDKDSTFLDSNKTLTADSSSVLVSMQSGKEQEFKIDAKNSSNITLDTMDSSASTSTSTSAFKGSITADSKSQITSKLANITASVDLKNGSVLNIANGGTLNLSSGFDSIKLDGEGTALTVDTVLAQSLSKITLDVNNSAQLNVKNFIFDGGNVNVTKYYGDTVLLRNSAINTFTGNSISGNIYLSGNSTLKANNNNNDSPLSISESGDTKISTEIGSKLDISKLSVTGSNSKVYLNLDLAKPDELKTKVLETQKVSNTTTSQQKNFDIEAKNGSSVYVNNWNMNTAKSDSSTANSVASLTTDANSTIHFATLRYDMTKDNKITSPIGANVSVSQNLSLENVGKVVNGTSTDDRFHALKLQNAEGNQKTLTFDNTSKINVSLDSSVSATNAVSAGSSATVNVADSTGDNKLELNKYYTLMSAGSIVDNRTDKRVYFTFASDATRLYWVTTTENGAMKVKFTKEDPTSYNELKRYIDNDDLLAILIQHNPENSFVQMAGTANQHSELNSYLAGLNSSMNTIAQSSTRTVSNDVLLANNETINVRVVQARSIQARMRHNISKYKFAMNAPTYTIGASGYVSDIDSEAVILSDSNKGIKFILNSIDEARKKNNAWANVGGGYFGQDNGSLVFYGTNFGYDRLFAIGENDYFVGVMAGIGGSKYRVTGAKENASFYNIGFYLDTSIADKHEVQSNVNFTYIDSSKALDSNGSIAGDSMRGGTFGWLWSTYYKYRFNIGTLGSYEQAIKPLCLIDIGFNGIGALNGNMYRQKAYKDFNIALGAGVEYSLIRSDGIYSIRLIARQGVYNTGRQIFVSLNNAQNFVAYDLKNRALGFQMNFVGFNQLPYSLSLQYGISKLIDIKGNFGVKGDMQLKYKF